MDDFNTWLSGLKLQMQRSYDRAVNRDLSKQNWLGLFGRNVRQVLLDVYGELLQQDGLELNEQRLLELSSLPSFLLQYAQQKHRTSCALSNFPEEHNPDQAYLAEVIQAVEQDWQAFISKHNSVVVAG